MARSLTHSESDDLVIRSGLARRAGMRAVSLLAIVVVLVLPIAPTGAVPGAASGRGALANGRIIFALDDPEQESWEVWTMAPDGTDAVRLTDDKWADDDTSYSPDGTKILFSSYRYGDWDIYVMDADGTDVEQIVDGPGADAEPTWSPDGTKIAYVTFRHDPDHTLSEIRVVRVDGTRDRRLTNNDRIEANIEWSPDGTRIAFSGYKPGSRYGIFTMSARGGDVERLTRNYRLGGGGVDGGPTWSPNGRWIAFFREMDAFEYGYEIFKIRVNGQRLTRLTRDLGTDQQPDWSPDGDYLVYTSQWQIATVTPNGRDRTQLTSDETIAHYSPGWQPLARTSSI